MDRPSASNDAVQGYRESCPMVAGMAAKKKPVPKARPARRMDRTGAGRNLLASMVACRAAIGMYVDKNRGGKGGKAVCAKARVGRASLTNLEICKGVVARVMSLRS